MVGILSHLFLRPFMTSTRDFDVAVIGGGPAGSAAASTLARRGHQRARLRARALSPVPHRRITAAVDQRDSARIGAEQTSSRARDSFRSGAQASRPRTATPISTRTSRRRTRCRARRPYQVPRERFDQVLLDHAAGCGARVLQGAAHEGRGVRCRRSHGHAQRSRMAASRVRVAAVIDASGRAGFLARRFGERRKDPVLQNISVHRQYEGIPRSEGRRAGDIRMVTRPDRGWFWFIPISDTVISVGAVVPQAVYNANATTDTGGNARSLSGRDARGRAVGRQCVRR